MEVSKNQLVLKELNRYNMNILDICYIKLDSSWKCANACSSFCRVYLICKGYGEIRIGKKVIPLLPGNIYVIPPNLDFSYSCPEYMEKLYFHINILKSNNYDIFCGYKSAAVFEKQNELINNMLKYWHKRNVESIIYIKCMLYSILSKTISISGIDLGKPEEYSEIIKKTIEIVENSLKSGLSAAEIASKLYISESSLQKSFKKETGVSLGKYISDRVMVAAEQKLKLTTSSIKAISDELGFCDQFYFSRQFKSKYGCSPTAYRIVNNFIY